MFFLISLNIVSHIILHKYIEFSSNKASVMIFGHQDQNITLIQNVLVNISSNSILELLFNNAVSKHQRLDIPMCYFQFYGNHSHTSTTNFKVVITYVNEPVLSENVKNINCYMLPTSTFYKHNHLSIYQQFIHFLPNSRRPPLSFDTGMLCYCSAAGIPKCHINTLGPAYPGQTLIIRLCINHKVRDTINNASISIRIYDDSLPKSHCKIRLSHDNNIKWITRNCTKFHYTVLSNNEEQCQMFLKNEDHKYNIMFYVKLLTCPKGFLLDNDTEKCECDLLMQSISLTVKDCNINDQTILRPGNSWMTAETYNNSHTYRISPNCPFQYCLQQSSYLNFSTPDSQCQYSRSGLLYGQCQQNFSSIFDSSNCKLCSNIYLLLIIPIAIAGVLLVFILFCINLTVTDGTINAFIMYTNIISINDHVFFTDTKHVFTPVYTFISLANLDLGIQTCFYNGMDDYAKMWLQLAFSFYLIFIATLLFITSHYSITVQRLTARRALPVLATLFILRSCVLYPVSCFPTPR